MKLCSLLFRSKLECEELSAIGLDLVEEHCEASQEQYRWECARSLNRMTVVREPKYDMNDFDPEDENNRANARQPEATGHGRE